MSKPVLFIHGAGGFYEDQALADSLQHHLGEVFRVFMPEMPDADEPSYAAWRDEITRQLGELNNPVLVGHSLGGSVLLKTLTEKPATAAGLFLLAAPYWGATDWKAKEYELPDGFAAKLPPSLPVFLYHNEDDEVVPFSHLKRYVQALPDAVARPYKRGGHQFRYHLKEVARDIKKVLAGENHA